MDKINLTPSKKSQHDLTANQFQEKLYNWFREQGLLSELRGHLRMQMVSALQDGSPSISSRQFSISPKVQALTVLIADFLLHQGYTYTLSVLVTEVPLIGQMFSQFSHSTIKEALESGNLLSERFSPRDVEDILETLGLVSGSELCSQALGLYQDNSNSDSLLLCVLRSLSKSNSNPWKEPRLSLMEDSHKEKKKEDMPGESLDQGVNKESEPAQGKDFWMQEMQNILLQNNIKLGHISHIQNYMKRIHEAEIWKVKEQEAAKYQTLLEERRQEEERRRTQEKHLVTEWRQQVETEIAERERNLCKLAGQLKVQHNEITEKLLTVETESEKMKQRERKLAERQEKGSQELEEKKSEVSMQKSKMEEALKRLAADQEAIARDKEELEKSKRDKEELLMANDSSLKDFDCLRQIQEQYSGLCHLLSIRPQTAGAGGSLEKKKEDKGLQTSPLPSPTTIEPTHALATEPDLISRIEEEKQELREHVIQQRRRIDELTMRAADLANQLQDAQVALQLVNPHQLTVTTPQLTAPPTARLHPRPAWPPHIGSGEETSFLAMNSGTRAANLTPSRGGGTTTAASTNTTATLFSGVGSATVSSPPSRTDTSVRRRARRVSTRPLNSSDDSTATEDMIDEARQRLRQLEEESTAVRQNYQDFRNRQNLESTMPSLFHPEQSRAHNVFDYRATGNSSLFGGEGQNTFMTGSRNASSRRYTTRIGSLTRPLFDSMQPGYGPHHTSFRPTAILRKGTENITEGDEIRRYQFPKYVRKPIALNTTSPTDSSSAFPNLSKKILQNSLKHFTSDSNGRSEIVKAMKASAGKTRTNCKENNENDDENVGPECKEDEELNDLQTEQKEQDALILEIKEKILHRKEMLKKTKEETAHEFLDIAADRKPTKSLKFSKTVTILENSDHSNSEGNRNGSTDSAMRNNSTVGDRSSHESTHDLNRGEETAKQHCSIRFKGKSCTNLHGMCHSCDDDCDEESVEVLLQRSLKSSSSTLPLQCDYYCSESEGQEEVGNDRSIVTNQTYNIPKPKALSLPAASAKTFSLSDKEQQSDATKLKNFKESGSEIFQAQSPRESNRPNISPRDSVSRNVRAAYSTNYLSAHDSQNRIAPLFGSMSPRESPMNRVASFILTGGAITHSQQVSPTNRVQMHSSMNDGEPNESFTLILNQPYEDPTDSPRSGGEALRSRTSGSVPTRSDEQKSDNGEEVPHVPFLNFKYSPRSNQSAESGTDRGPAEDSWREPGDGTDHSKPESDDPVSAGSQGTSSSANFW